MLTFLVYADGGGGLVGVGRGREAWDPHVGSVPGVGSGPVLSVQEAQLVIHCTLSHHLLVFTGKIS